MLEVPEGREDELAGALALGSSGARISSAGPGTSRLQIFLARPGHAERALARAAALLRRAGLAPEGCRLETVEVAEGGWVEAYWAGRRPFGLGTRFVVLPGGEEAAPGKREPIRLAPGRAFGTGEHPTTQLCASQLERRVGPGSRWLDLGCGTGILTVVADRCGASEVLALDEDATAVCVARGVFRANRVGRGVRVARGSVGEAEPGGWDGVVCNISAAFLVDAARRLAALVRDGGTLVASGFLSEELERVLRAAGQAGLAEEERAQSAEWALLVLRKP